MDFFLISLLFFKLSSLALGFEEISEMEALRPLGTISVDPSGHGNFSTIQAAIDFIPSNNRNWILVDVKAGFYREQVTIPVDKPFIYLRGEGMKRTTVIFDRHDSLLTSATFTSLADNVVVRGITFTNSYNYPPNSNGNPRLRAIAARISGDKSALYECAFLGVQDTLLDELNRHYFKECFIVGAYDFIFGTAQSIYEGCTIEVIAGSVDPTIPGYIAAQGRTGPNESNGFVFKECNVVGNGQTYLARAWRAYSRVVFYQSTFSNIIVPQGWDPWSYIGSENLIEFSEEDCNGEGADLSKRVSWVKKLSQEQLMSLTSMSFIDSEGWMSSQPYSMLD